MKIKRLVLQTTGVLVLLFFIAMGANLVSGRAGFAQDTPAPKAGESSKPTEASPESDSGLPDKPLYRPDSPIPGKEFDEARELMDEVIENGNGKDDFLNDERWDRVDEDTERGKKWAAGDDMLHFELIYGGIKFSLAKVEERADKIQKLKEKVDKTLEEKEKEFCELAEGDAALMHILKGLGYKSGGLALGKGLEAGSQWLKKAHAGKVIGAAGIVLGFYQFFLTYAEYDWMKYLLEDMLELLELRAYLEALLRQYDELAWKLEDSQFILREAWLNRKENKSGQKSKTVSDATPPLHTPLQHLMEDADRGDLAIQDNEFEFMDEHHGEHGFHGMGHPGPP